MRTEKYILFFLILSSLFTTGASCGSGVGGSASESGTVVGGEDGDTPIFDDAELDDAVLE